MVCSSMDTIKSNKHPFWRCLPTKMTMKSVLICLFSLFTISSSESQATSSDGFHRKGHLQPLGSHAIKHPVQVLDRFPTPQEFYTDYVYSSVPVVFRNAARKSPAFSKWTDEYMSHLPESAEEMVEVEAKKVENRVLTPTQMTFAEFVKQYKGLDGYLVSSVPQFLRSDVLVPSSLLCDRILEHILDMLMWFSAGGTKSVIHNDDVDNINCLISGTKEILFMNITKYRNQIVFDRPGGSYMGTNVESVDFDKYPQFEDMEFYSTTLSAGDCLYIPYKWIHQVNSFDRNIAVNIWWEHLTDLVPTQDCGAPNPDMSLADVELHEPEDLKQQLLVEFIKYIVKNKGATEDDIVDFIKTNEELHGIDWNGETLTMARRLLELIDFNNDRQLTKEDLSQLKQDEQSLLLVEQQLHMLRDVKLEQVSKQQLEILKKLQQSEQHSDKEEL